ncbi:cation:proton antiporter domain-containing protein [Streptomyces sp. LZ34]
MTGLELIVVVAATVLLMTWAARRLRLSEPLLLLIGGILIGLMPRFGNVHLPPDVVLLLFLPALLYWESLTTSLREIKNNFRSIALQATGLVLVTAVAVALVAHALGYEWPIAFVLGAVLAPTDVAAVAAVAMAMPRRILTLLRTESLLNDGTALVLLAVGLELLTTGEPFSWTHTAVRFVEAYAGGAAIGAAIALLLIPVRRHLHDRVLHSGLSVATPFIAYLPAEALHVSGVLAVVTCGLVTSRVGPKVIGSDARMQATSFWEVTTFLLNGALFVLRRMAYLGAIVIVTYASPRPDGLIHGCVGSVGNLPWSRANWGSETPNVAAIASRARPSSERSVAGPARSGKRWSGESTVGSVPVWWRSALWTVNAYRCSPSSAQAKWNRPGAHQTVRARVPRDSSVPG